MLDPAQLEEVVRMAAVRRVTDEGRRARLVVEHRLAADERVDDPVAAARSVVALHATDPASVFLGVAARGRDVRPSAVEAALYGSRALVRMMAMRRTLFVVPTDVAPIVQAAAADAVAERMEARLLRQLAAAGVAADPATWLSEVAAEVRRALERDPGLSGTRISEQVPRLRAAVVVGQGRRWETTTTFTTQVLALLGARGLIVRGKPTGAWNSSRYQWWRAGDWVALPAGPPVDDARADLARLWLRSFGPGTVDDLEWWTGWSRRVTRQVLSDVRPVEVDLAGRPGVALDDGGWPPAGGEPSAALLPALDPTVMGWRERGWFLGEHRDQLFDRSGNAGPTVWWHGHVVGGWAQRRDGTIAVQLLEDVGNDARAAISAEAERLERFCSDVRVTPRFRTPLERRLSA